jgi:hypothetical protein
VVVTDANGCVSEPCERTLTVHPNPSCEIDEPVEAGILTGTISGGTMDYTCVADVEGAGWSVGPCVVDGSTFSFTYSVSNPGADFTASFTVTVTDANDCVTECTKIVGGPTECVIEPFIAEICEGSEAQFCVTPVGGLPPFTYSWTGPEAFTADTECITVGVAGTYIAEVTDGNGFTTLTPCEATLIVYENPVCDIPAPMPPPDCGSERNLLCVEVEGGTPDYAYEWSVTSAGGDWIITSGQDTECIYYTAGQEGPATFTVIVTDANGCVAECYVEVPCLLEGDEYCSLTQGAYGNYGGYYGGYSTLELIQALLLDDDLLIGVPMVRSVTIPYSAAECIIKRLPAGGRPGALPDALGDETMSDMPDCQTPTPLPLRDERFNNVFLGQVITLALNVRLDFDPDPNNQTLGYLELCETMVTQGALCGDDGICGTADDELDPGPDGLFGTDDDPVMTIWIPREVIDALEADATLGNSVDGLLELANRALAGEPTGGARLSAIAEAVGAINDGFDECRFLLSCENENVKTRTSVRGR